MKVVSLLLLIWLSLLVFSCADNPSSPSFGSVNGKIINAQSLLGVSGVLISTDPPSQSILTDSLGDFMLSDISVGDTKILAKKRGYYDASVIIKINGGKTTLANLIMTDFKSDDNPPEVPALLNPPNNSTAIDSIITFSWSCSDLDGDKLTYDVYLSTSNPPKELIAENLSKTELDFALPSDSSNYFWKVVAKDTWGVATESKIQKFKFEKSSFTKVDNDLLLYYSFDDGTAKDGTNNNYNGQLMNNPIVVTGKYNKGMRLVSASGLGDKGSHIILPRIPFENYTEFTVSMWVYEENMNYYAGEAYICFGDASSGWMGIMNFVKSSGSSVLSYQFAVGAGYFNQISGLPSQLIVENDLSNRNKWAHFAMTYNAGTMKAYINGKKVGEVKQNLKIGSDNCAIGRHSWSGGTSTAFTGVVDEFRIYKRALTDSEILYLGK